MNERQINPITNYYHSHEKITNFKKIPFKWKKNESINDLKSRKVLILKQSEWK